jgi:hypothetical protein
MVQTVRITALPELQYVDQAEHAKLRSRFDQATSQQ